MRIFSARVKGGDQVPQVPQGGKIRDFAGFLLRNLVRNPMRNLSRFRASDQAIDAPAVPMLACVDDGQADLASLSVCGEDVSPLQLAQQSPQLGAPAAVVDDCR